MIAGSSGLGGYGCSGLRLPYPGQEVVQTGLRMICDAREHIGKPCFGIDVVEARRHAPGFRVIARVHGGVGRQEVAAGVGRAGGQALEESGPWRELTTVLITCEVAARPIRREAMGA